METLKQFSGRQTSSTRWEALLLPPCFPHQKTKNNAHNTERAHICYTQHTCTTTCTHNTHTYIYVCVYKYIYTYIHTRDSSGVSIENTNDNECCEDVGTRSPGTLVLIVQTDAVTVNTRVDEGWSKSKNRNNLWSGYATEEYTQEQL